MRSQNAKVNPIETRFLSHVDDSLGYTRVGQATGMTVRRELGSLGRGAAGRRGPFTLK
jgi:hypothetical protein